MGSINGPIIESIKLLILSVSVPIKSCTAHSSGFINPFLTILTRRFFIVLFNAFLIVEPRHPNALKSPPMGLKAAFTNASFCAIAASGLVILLKIKFLAAIKPRSINSINLPSSKPLKLVVNPSNASDISLTAVSRPSTIVNAFPRPPDAPFRNFVKEFDMDDAPFLGKHLYDTAAGIQVMFLFDCYIYSSSGGVNILSASSGLPFLINLIISFDSLLSIRFCLSA